MNGHILIEACCGSARDAMEAARGGADRIELNSGLSFGGLTPTTGAVEAVKDAADIPVFCMLRPREGGFCYSETEFDCLLRDERALLRAGADGVVCGCLNADGTVDTVRMARVMENAHGKPVVFHRAIDVVPDWRAALDALCGLGISRVLTSGQRPTAMEGADTLRMMRAYADGRITILPGCGIRLENAAELIRKTGCDQLHLSGGHVYETDLTAQNDRGIVFPDVGAPGAVPVTDADYFRRLRRILDK